MNDGYLETPNNMFHFLPDHSIALQWREYKVDSHELHSNVLKEALVRLYNCPVIKLGFVSGTMSIHIPGYFFLSRKT